jgi:hypothetical protein
LIDVPVRENLRAENSVAADPRAAEKKARLFQVGRNFWPVEHRDVAQVDEVVPTGDATIVLDHRVERLGIDLRIAREGVEHGPP